MDVESIRVAVPLREYLYVRQQHTLYTLIVMIRYVCLKLTLHLTKVGEFYSELWWICKCGDDVHEKIIKVK